MAGNQSALQTNRDFGPDYSIQCSTNLTDWSTVFTASSPVLPFDWFDPNPAQSVLFHRILLSPKSVSVTSIST
jgi:hypothetical protein